MVTLLRLHSLFETLSTVAKLQTKSRTQESQGRVRAALLIYLSCYYLFGCLFVFCNRLFCCCFSFLMLKFYYIYVTFFLIPNHHLYHSRPQSSSLLRMTDGEKSSGEPLDQALRYLWLVETKKARLIGQSATR